MTNVLKRTHHTGLVGNTCHLGINVVLIAAGALMPLSVHADYRNFLFTPETLHMPDVSATLTDELFSSTVTTLGNFSGHAMGTVAYANCSGGSDVQLVEQTKAAWLLMDSKFSIGGVEVTMEPVLSGGWGPASGHGWGEPAPGTSASVNVKVVYTQLGPCWPLGSRQSVDWYLPPVSVKLTGRRQSLPAGQYTVPIKYYYGYEEHKRIGVSAPPNTKLLDTIRAQPPGIFNMNINVQSKCTFNTNPITLQHGTVQVTDIKNGHTSRPYRVAVNCSPGTSVSVKTLGNERVSGSGPNYTKCGTGGVCGITFNDGKSDEVMKVSGPVYLDVVSTYRPNDAGRPVAGAFTGSGVLQLFVN